VITAIAIYVMGSATATAILDLLSWSSIRETLVMTNKKSSFHYSYGIIIIIILIIILIGITMDSTIVIAAMRMIITMKTTIKVINASSVYYYVN